MSAIFINESINEVYHTLYEAGFLVLVVILIFLQNFRATLVPATTVPVTIIGTFVGMYALGYSVNLSTLFGVVLAIGIVVDDAIVVLENIARHIERGRSVLEASLEGVREVAFTVISISISLVVAVTVEIVINPRGLGYGMIIAQQTLRSEVMYAQLIWLGLLGWALNALLERAVELLDVEALEIAIAAGEISEVTGRP